jgi:hypothetical protein
MVSPRHLSLGRGRRRSVWPPKSWSLMAEGNLPSSLDEFVLPNPPIHALDAFRRMSALKLPHSLRVQANPSTWARPDAKRPFPPLTDAVHWTGAPVQAMTGKFPKPEISTRCAKS